MGKKKEKKTSMQKALKKIRKFFVNGKPMSQTIHWTIILSIAWLYAIKMAEASNTIGEIYSKGSSIM